VYYGDRECDLAMTELFGGFSPDFYAAYNHVYPLENGYQQRKKLYNLYHILNHANLFGSVYIMQSKAMMQQLIRQAS
jgi:fructosamine-3-kinase